ncbi:MAG TPA: glycosyltransferase family 4 protein [Acidobacteriota bacterium]
MKKKIAFVIQRYGEEVVGGAESLCRGVAERLIGFYNVDILTTCALDYYHWKNHFPEGTTECNGASIHRFKVRGFRQHRRFHRLSKRVYSQPHSLEEERQWLHYQGPVAPALYQHLDSVRHHYAAVFFFTYLYPTTVDGIGIAPERSILVPTAHDEHALYLSIFRPVFHLPRMIFYNTEEEKQLVQRVFRNEHVPSEVVGVGVDIPEDIPQKAQRVPGQSRAMLLKKPFFLYLGRVDIDKGVKELVQWFLNSSLSDVDLVIAGPRFMELPSHDRLHVLGQIDEAQKASLLRQSLGLILPSLYESLSLSALEAWAFAKPVVARKGSKVLEEHLRSCDGGILFEDAPSLSEAMKILQSNSTLSEKMGERGRSYVAEKYSWKRVVDSYVRSVERVSATAS